MKKFLEKRSIATAEEQLEYASSLQNGSNVDKDKLKQALEEYEIKTLEQKLGEHFSAFEDEIQEILEQKILAEIQQYNPESDTFSSREFSNIITEVLTPSELQWLNKNRKQLVNGGNEILSGRNRIKVSQWIKTFTDSVALVILSAPGIELIAENIRGRDITVAWENYAITTLAGLGILVLGKLYSIGVRDKVKRKITAALSQE